MIKSQLFIRYRGAAGVIYRYTAEVRDQRQSMERVGHINIKTQELKLASTARITAEEEAYIYNWVAQRKAHNSVDRAEEVRKLCDQMNLMTQWILDNATPEDLEAYSDDLLLSLMDLRNSVVRRRSQALAKK